MATKFTPEQIEKVAKAEHGAWLVWAGDVAAEVDQEFFDRTMKPYIASWEDLPEHRRMYFRSVAVRKLEGK